MRLVTNTDTLIEIREVYASLSFKQKKDYISSDFYLLSLDKMLETLKNIKDFNEIP